MCGCSVLICPEGKGFLERTTCVSYIDWYFLFQKLRYSVLEPYACESSGHELARVVVFGETVPSAESLGWLFEKNF
ncbi:hypothetical protein CEXT_417281 [Caerostris extrusa]|uniref:Uncharacterized protein n=1 Tax=Caerostris extrusa TaxID=172846 RepID=A0AAV4PA42_CAEEX|nr:hypothetical protein CEXT_417281 [Caerostris extrusa]